MFANTLFIKGVRIFRYLKVFRNELTVILIFWQKFYQMALKMTNKSKIASHYQPFDLT